MREAALNSDQQRLLRKCIMGFPCIRDQEQKAALHRCYTIEFTNRIQVSVECFADNPAYWLKTACQEARKEIDWEIQCKLEYIEKLCIKAAQGELTEVDMALARRMEKFAK